MVPVVSDWDRSLLLLGLIEVCAAVDLGSGAPGPLLTPSSVDAIVGLFVGKTSVITCNES